MADRPPPERRGNAARLFGYDIFVSFALGPPPRGSRSYASDLARRLRERDFTVFFSEEEAPAGDQLDDTLRRALRRSRILVVIANAGTLADPRWVRSEVEEFRRVHPERPIIPINIGGALQTHGAAAEGWLQYSGKIWLDETQSAGDEGVVTDGVLERLTTAPNALRAGRRWRWTVRAAFAVLSIVTASAIWFARSNRQNAALAVERRLLAEKNAAEARTNAQQARANAERAELNERSAEFSAMQARLESERARIAEGQARAEAAAARAAERRAQAGRLAAESQLARATDPRLALLWAREAWNRDRGVASRRALYEALGEPVPLEVAADLGNLRDVAYSADGRFIATAHPARGVFLRDTTTRRNSHLLLPDWVKGVAFSPDGATLASLDDDARVQLWDPATRTALGEPLVHPELSGAWAVAWTPDGRTLAVGGVGPDTFQRIVLWDVASRSAIGEPLRPEPKESVLISRVAFSPNGKLLAATMQTAIQVWDVTTRQLHVPPIPARVMSGHVAFLDDERLAIDGPGYEVTRWDLKREKAEPPPFGGYSDWVESFAQASAAPVSATGGADGTIRLWRGDVPQAIGTPLTVHKFGASALAFVPDGTSFASVGRDGRVIQWLLNTGGHRFKGREPRPRDGADMTLSDDGRWLVYLRESGRVEWHDLMTGRMAHVAEGVEEVTEGVAVAPDGTVAFQSSPGLTLHGPGDRNARCSIDRSTYDIVFSPNSLFLATFDGPNVQLWRARDCHQFADFRAARDNWTITAAFSADSKSVLVGDESGIRFWNVAPFRLEKFSVNAPDALHIATDGRLVASAHLDGVIRLARIGSDAEPAVLQGPYRTHVRGIALSPDGLWLASVGDDGRAVLWDLGTNQPLDFPIEAGQGHLRFVAFSADSRRLITHGTDGPPALWEISDAAWAEQACRVAQRNPTCSEWQRVFGPAPYQRTCPAFPPPPDASRCGAR